MPDGEMVGEHQSMCKQVAEGFWEPASFKGLLGTDHSVLMKLFPLLRTARSEWHVSFKLASEPNE